jgi:mannose-6-phosphate isomerase-like protein (cupin superfamily)
MIKKINLQKVVDNDLELFQYLGIGKLNDHVLKAENRTLNFHVHEKSDELFYVIEGRFEIELDNGIIEMEQGDLIIIPKEIRHRPICKSLVNVC